MKKMNTGEIKYKKKSKRFEIISIINITWSVRISYGTGNILYVS